MSQGPGVSAGTALPAPWLQRCHAVCSSSCPGGPPATPARVAPAVSQGGWLRPRCLDVRAAQGHSPSLHCPSPMGNHPHADPSATGNKFSPCHAGVLLLCVWAYALMFATAPLAEWGSYGPEPYGTACCITWKASSREATLYILALFIFCYLLPCLLILVSYSLILWTVRVSRRAVRQHTSPQRGARSVHSLIVKVGEGSGCCGVPTALWAGECGRIPSARVSAAPGEFSRCLYQCG